MSFLLLARRMVTSSKRQRRRQHRLRYLSQVVGDPELLARRHHIGTQARVGQDRRRRRRAPVRAYRLNSRDKAAAASDSRPSWRRNRHFSGRDDLADSSSLAVQFLVRQPVLRRHLEHADGGSWRPGNRRRGRDRWIAESRAPAHGQANNSPACPATISFTACAGTPSSSTSYAPTRPLPL